MAEWQDDDEVVTTYRSIKQSQEESYRKGFWDGISKVLEAMRNERV